LRLTQEDVSCYLKDIKAAIKEKRYEVSVRAKNEQLFTDYVFTEKKREDILLSLDVDDFSEAVNNQHPKFADEVLYIFGKNVALLPRFGGKEVLVPLYIKFNLLKSKNCIVISFHQQEHPLKYAFK